MDIQDTFPQRVWQIVASIPEGLSRPTAMSPGLPVRLGGASGWRSFKTSAGRQHFAMA
ncbi:methylated-DNA methyltransferase [Salmonella enterica]|nr:methylated-DNA methyltransferase [Salmonella enterica]